MSENNLEWACPWCGCKDMWFDRTVSFLPDGTEIGMKDRCEACGKAIDDVPTEESKVSKEDTLEDIEQSGWVCDNGCSCIVCEDFDFDNEGC